MPGTLARNFRSANRSEVLAHFLLSTWGTVTSVAPVDDYGIDLYCTLTENVGLRSIVTDYYSVQVKSNDDPWVFETKEEIRWLFDYSTPLFLACVDRTKTVLSIYHTMARFLAGFWPEGERLTLEPTNDIDGVSVQWSGGEQFSLSAPIIRVSLAELSDSVRLDSLRRTFQHWVRLENYNCDLRRVGVLRFRMPDRYKVNEVPVNSGIIEQGRWRITPEQLAPAVRTLVEVVDCVGHQLLGAGDPEGTLYAALLLRHVVATRQGDLAGDPRWSQGSWPGPVYEVARPLNAALNLVGPTNGTFEGLDQLASLVRGLPFVAKYLGHTQDQNDPKDQSAHYALALGKLFGNLGSLDVALRAVLYAAHPTSPGREARPHTSLNVGDQVEENWITKQNYLSDLVNAYNALQDELGRPEQKIDSGIVDLRNALAHGFVTASDAGGILTLMKFGKGKGPTPRPLQVTAKIELTPEWMSEQMVRVRDALLKIKLPQS